MESSWEAEWKRELTVDLRGASGQDKILIQDRSQNVLGSQCSGLQEIRIEIDHDLPLLAAVRIRVVRQCGLSELH